MSDCSRMSQFARPNRLGCRVMTGIILSLCVAQGVAAQARPAAPANSTPKKTASRPAKKSAPRATTTAAKQPAAANPATAPGGAESGTASEGKSSIVAVVNGQSVTRAQLAELCIERYGQPVLESLVNKHLILEACRQHNIKITVQDIEAEIDRIAARFNLPKDRWMQMLREERNISAEQYRRDIIWPTLALQQLAAGDLQITEAELTREFESEYGEKVQVRMIAVSSKTKAAEILKEVQAAPDTFGAAAKQHSEDPNSAAARGLIPPIRRHIGQPEIEKACFALQANEISPIIPVAGQFLIFQCEKRLPPAHISPQYRQTANDRLRERLVDRKLRDASSKIFATLQQGVKVVNVLNDPELSKQLPGVAATINGAQITMDQLADECIARHGVNVLDSEINYLLLTQALKSKSVTVKGEEIDGEVARAAETYGYLTADKKPDIQRWLKEVTESEGLQVETYIRDAVWPSVALKKLVESGVQVTDEDLEKGFEANYGPRIEALAVVLSSQRTAQEVWDMARSNRTPKFFGELASQYSIEPVSRANMGEVPPIRRFSGQPKVEEEAFKFTKDDPLSAIIAIADKYIILYYVGRTEPVVTDLADVKDELLRDIHEKKLRLAMSQEFDRLKDVAQIDNFLAGNSQDGRTAAVRAGSGLPPRAGGAATTAPSASAPAGTNTAGRPARTSPQLVRPASQQTRRSK